MAGLRTEFEFTLPKGYVDPDGTLHRHGVMRLATARDEIEPLRDRSIEGPDDPYLTILVLARVITQLGSVPTVGVREVEGLFAADLAFLQDLYGIINFGDQADVEALQASVLPADTAPAEHEVEPEPVPASISVSATDAPPDDAEPRDDVQTSSRKRAHIEEVARVASP
jgi:hypothetical protein